MTYPIDICGLQRELPLCPLNENLSIGAFVIFGDVELTEHCAKELLKRAPDFDYLIAPEAKAIPLVYEMSRQIGEACNIPVTSFDGDQADPRNFSEAQYDTRVQGLVEIMDENKAAKGAM